MSTGSDARPSGERSGRFRPSIFSQFLLAFAVIVFAMTGAFTIWFYLLQRDALLKGIDGKLYSVAVMARDLLPAGWHDRIASPGSVSDAEYLAIVDRHNRLCVELGLEYIWSLVQIDGNIYFTTATSPDKIAANRNHAAFFELHSNPELYLSTFTTMKPVFQISDDKWGRIRVALVPFRDAAGRAYLFGASERMTDVDAQLSALLRGSVHAGLTFLVLGILSAWAMARSIARPLVRLTEVIGGIASGREDLVAAVEGSREQAALARSLNMMNQAIREAQALADAEGKKLKESEARWQFALEGSGDGVWDWDMGTGSDMLSDRWKEMLGFAPGEIGSSYADWESRLHPEDHETCLSELGRYLSGATPVYRHEHRMRRKDGSWAWILGRGMVTSRLPDGKPERMIGTHSDISARKESELEIRRLLAEKETLLREVHHRIKNNMGIVMSLLSLQAGRLEPEDPAFAALREAENRIQTMMILYDRLYRSSDFRNIEVDRYFRDMIGELMASYATAGNVRLELDMESFKMDAATLVPVSIIVNELVMNAFKYAFPGGRNGLVRVSLHRTPEGRAELLVTDDGVGIPQKGAAGGFGHELIGLLARQIGAGVAEGDEGGYSFRMDFAVGAEG